MTLFITCPSCMIEVWGWQRTCFACGAACRPRPAASPQNRGRQSAMASSGASIVDLRGNYLRDRDQAMSHKRTGC
jgi:hypothetical protein